MKPFQFSLGSVLRIEYQVDQLVNIRLAEAKHRLDAESAKLTALQEEVVAAQDSLSGLTPDLVASNWNAYRERMSSEMQKQVAKIRERQHEYHEVLREKLIRNQRIEGLKKLEDKERKQHQLAQDRELNKKLLDTVILRKKRNAAGR